MATYLIINTGGTIGMVSGSKGLEPHPEAIARAFQHEASLRPWQQHILRWQHWSPLLDSSDLQPEHWFQLQATIQAANDIDGVLIVHGTDTLAYTAAALSFLLGDLTFPVVITGSMHPIDTPDTDAIGNLQVALNTLQQGRAEVMACIGTHTLPGSRLTKASTLKSDAFSTPGWSPSLWSEPPARPPVRFEAEWQQPKVSVITLFPGAELPTAEQLGALMPDAILINAYGNGNIADTANTRASLSAMQSLDIPVFVRSQCHEGEVNFGQYAASALFTDHNAVSCGQMSFEAALTKVQLLCSASKDAQWIRQQFATPFAREWQHE